jgi:hypothetical protein
MPAEPTGNLQRRCDSPSESQRMAAVNLIVFRDGRQEISGNTLLRRLRNALDNLRGNDGQENILHALLIAGELESGLQDTGWPSSHCAVAITDALAESLLGTSRQKQSTLWKAIREIESKTLPRRVETSSQEGFIYYALHPFDFAEAASEMGDQKSVAVVGIRSIGTVLSAVCAAAIGQQGGTATRITVRPIGHPYDRVVRLTEPETRWIDEQRQKRSTFLVVDEGPGLSGSSFLSTAEALVSCGVKTEEIVLLGTHEVNPEQLCSPNAAERWRQFKWRKAPSSIMRDYSHLRPLGAGEWRRMLLGADCEWPACWPEMERLKFFSNDGKYLLKFEGLGQFGRQARDRAQALAKAGFGPGSETAGDGMTAYQFISGISFTREKLSQQVLDRLVDYCAFRLSAFSCDTSHTSKLGEITRFNFSQEFGRDPQIPDASLQTSRPVCVDGRMQPHEWIAGRDGRILKVDANTHGDDHFLPGPTDIGWDVAGTIEEWHLTSEARDFVLKSFRKRTGQDLRGRIDAFCLAYAVFKMSFCKMAISGTQTELEKPRLRCEYEYYRHRAWNLFKRLQGEAAN